MKIAKNKHRLITILSAFWFLFVLLLVPLFVTGTGSALTRMQDCQSRQSDAAVQEECVNKINLEAWNECITKPEAERGPCAEAYKNGTATNAAAESEQLTRDQVLNTDAKGDVCGGGDNNDTVKTIINIGCRGKGNAIVDLIFAIIRILSIGVGIVVIGSLIFAGIQYIMSAGNPSQTQAAIERIRNTVFALILYIFAYALLNWLIPAGILNG